MTKYHRNKESDLCYYIEEKAVNKNNSINLSIKGLRKLYKNVILIIDDVDYHYFLNKLTKKFKYSLNIESVIPRLMN